MELNKKAAYLQGLVDGLGIDDTTLFLIHISEPTRPG